MVTIKIYQPNKILKLLCPAEYRIKSAGHAVYLTFDDGAGPYTAKLLDVLKKYNAKATFFMLEERIVMYPDYVKEIINKGNAVGLHGISHSEKIYEKFKKMVAYTKLVC